MLFKEGPERKTNIVKEDSEKKISAIFLIKSIRPKAKTVKCALFATFSLAMENWSRILSVNICSMSNVSHNGFSKIKHVPTARE